jgi:hypothetical protein
MKKAFLKYKITLFYIPVCLFLFNFLSCGLDTFTVIEDPNQVTHLPTYESLYDEKYFVFQTRESDNSSNGKFKGTSIFYKIYSDREKMTSEAGYLNTTGNSSATDAETLINRYGIKELKIEGHNDWPLIEETSTDRKIYIRLSNFQDEESLSAQIRVDSINGTDGTSLGTPIRNFDDLTFDFGRTSSNSEKNKVPVTGTDDDVSTSTTVTSEGDWYVSLFAVGVGMETTYNVIYSNILYLGSVTIDANAYDN